MCKPTTPGYYATAGSEAQTPCSPGTYQPNHFTSSCEACPAGKFQDKFGQPNCSACTQGYYCPNASVAALPCPETTYSDATDLISPTYPSPGCKPTDPGFYATTGSAKQIPCGPGTIAPNSKTAKCEDCAAGKYRGGTTNATVCDECTPGNYCPVGTGAPLPCEEGTYWDRTGLVDASQVRVRAITPTVSLTPTPSPTPNPSPIPTPTPTPNPNPNPM